MRDLLPENRPLLILAPMQDITDLPFWRVMAHYGGPDVYYTEYFRVHRDSRPEKYIVRSIEENPDGKPVIAQMIGQDIEALRRTALDLQRRRIAGIDINLGCPAPIVCARGWKWRVALAILGIVAVLIGFGFGFGAGMNVTGQEP